MDLTPDDDLDPEEEDRNKNYNKLAADDPCAATKKELVHDCYDQDKLPWYIRVRNDEIKS